ncbi:MAG: acyltransferase [Terrimicrobiaceae bacterium]|nr:acyltransferase [Terrimicrobiaceae bacterium]
MENPSAEYMKSQADQNYHLQRVDILRGVAILLVLMNHYWAAATQGLMHAGLAIPGGWLRATLFPMEFGFLGVKLFFVVSGFCIHLSYLKWVEKNRTAALPKFLPLFFWRRFFRIYPPYLLALLLFWVWNFRSELNLRAVWHLAVHASLLHSLSQPFFYEINWSFWSIAVEWQLYLIYPLFLLMTRWKGTSVAFLIAGSVATIVTFFGGYVTDSFLLLHSPFAYWLEWCVGALVADHFVNKGPRVPFAKLLLAVSGIVMAVSMSQHLAYQYIYFGGTAFFALLIHLAVSSKKPVPEILKPVAALGIISYSVYLLHQPLIVWSFPFIPSAWVAAMPGIVLWIALPVLLYAIILIPCIAFHRWVELPSISLGKSLWNRLPKGRTVRSPAPVGIPARW